MYAINIDYSRCDGCGKCAVICPRMVFIMEDGLPVLFDASNCGGCLSCAEICPHRCIEVKEW
ncbi:MAG: 4Fe-4S binding protein [Nitrospirae bacterium]|nr:4Fe-4S binding protein [Nitrospirota bacterium]